MTAYSFAFADADLRALPSGALHWPAQQMLVVSDLHFGKSARLARRGGGLLPPYETRATLQRLEADLVQTQAAQVICLGDSFDDLTAETELDTADRATLLRLMGTSTSSRPNCCAAARMALVGVTELASAGL